MFDTFYSKPILAICLKVLPHNKVDKNFPHLLIIKKFVRLGYMLTTGVNNVYPHKNIIVHCDLSDFIKIWEIMKRK